MNHLIIGFSLLNRKRTSITCSHRERSFIAPFCQIYVQEVPTFSPQEIRFQHFLISNFLQGGKMQLNSQGLELLYKKNSCLSKKCLHLGSGLALFQNRYEWLPNRSCCNVPSCLIGAIRSRIRWVVVFFFFSFSPWLTSPFILEVRNPGGSPPNNAVLVLSPSLSPGVA